jgi:hypothetical protein
MANEVISRAEAKAKGLSKYWTGSTCCHGHIAERVTANGTCFVCYSDTLERYRRDNPDRIRETDRLHRWANADHHNAVNREWRKRNSELARERDRVRYANGDPDLHRKHRRDRKARQKGAPGSHTLTQIKDLLRRQRFKCVGCNGSLKKARHLDHIKPLARSGSNDISNLQWLCPECNLNKHAKDPILWANENGRLL